MYRNSIDKRVKQSGDALFDAICRLMTQKNFDDIGIKEVCEEAGIGRATFYRNFDYVEDVLKLRIDETFIELMRRHAPEEFDKPAKILPFFEFWVEHSYLLKVLTQANRWAIFDTRFRAGSEIHLADMAQKMGFNESQLQYLQNSVIGLITSILHTWIERGQQEDADGLMKMFELPFKVYLFRQGITEQPSPESL